MTLPLRSLPTVSMRQENPRSLGTIFTVKRYSTTATSYHTIIPMSTDNYRNTTQNARELITSKSGRIGKIKNQADNTSFKNLKGSRDML